MQSAKPARFKRQEVMDNFKTLKEHKELIELFMEYAVPGELAEQAITLLEKYEADIIGLNLFHNFYSCLPEGTEDSIEKLLLLGRKQGVFLLCASSSSGINYLYLVNNEGAVLLGTLSEGIEDQELLDFFGFKDNVSFLGLAKDITRIEEYEPSLEDSMLCPACQTAVGEYHILGCPVEICPWCGGQLTRCNCRFTWLDVENINRESQIEKLQERLDAEGRVPFAKEHSPGYLADDLNDEIEE
jgi:hypothetical protein